MTLQTTIGKLYKKVKKDTIVKYFNTRGFELTYKMQGAAKEMISSLHTNIVLRKTIHYTNERTTTVYLTCLDIEKAFDNEWYNELLYKL